MFAGGTCRILTGEFLSERGDDYQMTISPESPYDRQIITIDVGPAVPDSGKSTTLTPRVPHKGQDMLDTKSAPFSAALLIVGLAIVPALTSATTQVSGTVQSVSIYAGTATSGAEII